jgi:hypothetical protein
MSEVLNLSLNDLSKGHPGLTSVHGDCLKEAAMVCFNANSHTSGVKLMLKGEVSQEHSVLFEPITQQMLDSYADMQEATELGACGVAIGLLSLYGYRVRYRAQKGSSFDYWLTDEKNDFFRLEVSGILKANTSNSIDNRLNIKRNQVVPDKFPAFIVIVDFGKPESVWETK